MKRVRQKTDVAFHTVKAFFFFLRQTASEKFFWLTCFFFAIAFFLTCFVVLKDRIQSEMRVLKTQAQHQSIRADFRIYQLKQQLQQLERMFLKPVKDISFTHENQVDLVLHDVSTPALVTKKEQSLSAINTRLLGRLLTHAPRMLGQFLKYNRDIANFYFIEENFSLVYQKPTLKESISNADELELLAYPYPVLKRLSALFKGFSGIQGSDKSWHIRYVHPVFQDQLLLGFFVITIPQIFFGQLLNTVSLSAGHLFFVDNQNRILAHKTPKTLTTSIELLKKYLKQSGDTVLEEDSSRGRHTCLTYSLKEGPFRFVLLVNKYALFYEHLKTLLKEVAFVFLSFFMLVLTLWIWLRTKVMRPFKQLINHINQERLNVATSDAGFSGAFKTWAQLITTAFEEKRGKAVMMDRMLKSYESQLSTMLTYLSQTQRQLFEREKLASVGIITMGFTHRAYHNTHIPHLYFEHLLKHINKASQKTRDALEAHVPQLVKTLEQLSAAHEKNREMLREFLLHTDASVSQNRCVVSKTAKNYIKLTLESFFALYGASPMLLNITFPQGNLHLPLTPHHFGAILTTFLFRAMQVASTHAKKHAQPGFVPQVHLTFKAQKRTLEIVLQDTGSPLPENITEKEEQEADVQKSSSDIEHWELQTKHLIEHYSGSLSSQNKNGLATFCITLPLLKSA